MKKGGLLLGYARVSKADDQDNAAQVKALRLAGCKRVFEEKASGGRWDRPQLHNALEQLREGDVLVVWKLDRLSRSLKDLLQIMEKVSDAGAGFRSITEAVDTTTSAGRMLMQMLGSFAEFERSMVRERTQAGLAAARDRGARLGRPAKLSAHQQQEVIKAVRDGSKTAADAARLFGLHRSNITRLLERSEMNADRNQPNRSSTGS
ncbi:MAG TPA: recombinase family protein [Chthoniobacterales bacterium]|jgi:DNA invertase Pin-like site-specific DNA recombinase|nr:recombinase family protein [Chthoniobacterales bacterium]